MRAKEFCTHRSIFRLWSCTSQSRFSQNLKENCKQLHLLLSAWMICLAVLKTMILPALLIKWNITPAFCPIPHFYAILAVQKSFKWVWMTASLQTDFSRGVYVGTFQLSKSTEEQLLVNAAATVLTAWMSLCFSAHWLPELTERDKPLLNPLQFSLKCLGSLERPLRL